MQTETAENHLKFPPMLKQSLWTLLITAPGLPSEGHYYQTVNSVCHVGEDTVTMVA